jgi:hypothetical protein
MPVLSATLRAAAVAAAVTVFLGSGLAYAGATDVASAKHLPVVYQGMAIWSDPSVRPHVLVLGADYDVAGLKWKDWRSHSASGHGRLDDCAGASGPCTKYRAVLTLTDVKLHHHRPYFAALKITGKHHRTRLLVMRGGIWLRK